MWIVGSDIGGTFTDLIAIHDDGELRVSKVPSTPPQYEQGIIDGLRALGIPMRDVQLQFHGTTVATNAVITKKGAKTGIVATQGFRDLLELRRANRGVLYDLMWDPPPPLVPRRHRLEVEERVNYRGDVVTPLNEEQARHAARVLKRRGMEAVAVCFLNSFTNSTNEERMRQILAEEFPEAYLSISYQVLPQPPEFERTSTVVANAYLGPIASRYLSKILEAMRNIGYEGELLVMHSGGGLLTPQSATLVPVRLAVSGPAAGVLAAAAIGRAIRRDNIISMDMGGTSCDIALIRNGQPRVGSEFEVEWGVPVLFPHVDLITIGAGGGSIAWIDPAGYPKSGPQSAGSVPGPACYGKGGEEPTTTDANLILGRLNPDTILGGKMKIDRELARRAVDKKIATPLGLDVVEAAAGIVRVANANMVAALHLVTTQRGYDPRETSLLAFGGAGPLHCVELARELEIPEVIVPPLPGITSAMGLLFADLVHDLSNTYVSNSANIDYEAVEGRFQAMEAEAIGRLEREGQMRDTITIRRSIDFKYAGQVRSINIGIGGGRLDGSLLEEAIERFHAEHQREYGYMRRNFSVETAVLRVSASGLTPTPSLRWNGDRSAGTIEQALKDVRETYFDGYGYVRTAVYDRDRLAPGMQFGGPAIVEQNDATTLLPPNTPAQVDDFGNIIIRLK